MFQYKFSHVFIGCCSSAFLMEVLMAKMPNSATLVTFLQFLFITLQGFVVTTKFGKVAPKIPMKDYGILVALFFISSVANNYVYALHVPSTLHMIIRSASSPASLLVYCLVKKQKPKLNKIVGSILISMGVALAMYGGAPPTEQKGKLIYWSIGVTILISTLITGAFTGLQQELLFNKHGKHPDEMMFYTHAIPLPLFIGIYPQLKTTSMDLSLDIWLLIILNILAQYYCTHSVHKLATTETTVTVTFILTLRKFTSLIISSIVFTNNLTMYHFIGTVSVILGTYIYFDYFISQKQISVSLKNK